MTDSTDNARGPERISFRKAYISHAITSGPLMDHPDYVQYVRADLAPDPLGAVKLNLLTEEDRDEIIEAAYQAYFKHHSGGAAGQLITEWDGIESWVIQATEARIRSALEPCDPQDDARVKTLVEAANETVRLLWEEMSKQGNVGTHGGYIYAILRPALAAFDKGEPK